MDLLLILCIWCFLISLSSCFMSRKVQCCISTTTSDRCEDQIISKAVTTRERERERERETGRERDRERESVCVCV